MARLALALSLLFWSTAWGGPAFSGLWSAGDLGLLEVSSTVEGKVVAKFKRGGQCSFKPDIPVLIGTFEGNVFIGNVLLCQVGPSCQAEANYPFLGLWHEGSLFGEVKLDSACHSPGLKLKRLIVTTANGEDNLTVRQDSAAQVANAKPLSKRDHQELVDRALQVAQKKMKEGDFPAAGAAFERATALAEDNWAAHAGLGGAQLMVEKNPNKPLRSLQRAAGLAKGSKAADPELGELFYNLARAQCRAGLRRDALQSLSRAVKLLPQATMAEQLDKDHDFDPLRNDSEFRRLLADARVARERLNRKRSP